MQSIAPVKLANSSRAILIVPVDSEHDSADAMPTVYEVSVPDLRDPEIKLANLMYGATLALAVFLAAVTIGFCASPIPSQGGAAEGIPAWLWDGALWIVIALKFYGRRHAGTRWERMTRRAAAMWGFMVWVGFSIAVYLPQVPVMAWIFCPFMAVAEAMLYVAIAPAKRQRR